MNDDHRRFPAAGMSRSRFLSGAPLDLEADAGTWFSLEVVDG